MTANQTSKNMKISKNKIDIQLMSSVPALRILDDTDGMEGIASLFVCQKRAAAILGISIPTLRKYVKLGFITRYSHGSRRYYRIDELERAKANIF